MIHLEFKIMGETLNYIGFHVNRIFSSKEQKKPTKQASSVYSRELFSIFDGEKNTGELGSLVKYELDYNGLRLRSWESYLSSEITQTVAWSDQNSYLLQRSCSIIVEPN